MTANVKVENFQSQIRKGTLEFIILLIIATKGPVYASDILQLLTSAKLLVVEGTLYPILTRLKNNGLLEYSWQESTSGPPRKYYSLTPTGQETLFLLQASWESLSSSINSLIKS